MKPSILFLIGFLSLLSFTVRGEPAMAQITTDTAAGSVQYQLPGTTEFKNVGWKDTVKVPVGTVVKTNQSGIAHVEVFPGGKVVVMPNSTFTVSSLNVETKDDKIVKRSGQITMEEGTVKALLSHKGANTSPVDFSVKTPTSVAAAKGTKYVVATVTVNGVSTTYVAVIEGTVVVTTPGKAGSTSVSAGQVVAVGAGGAATTSMSALPSAVQAALSAAIAAGVTTVSGTPTINTSDAANAANAENSQSAHSAP